MRRLVSVYVVFLLTMAALAIIGAALLIAGGSAYHALPRPWPGAALTAQVSPL